MTELGKIIATNGSFATVRIDKKDECSKCGMCAFPKNATHLDVNATNEQGAEVGDTVRVNMEKDNRLIGSVLVFLVPLLMIGLAVLVTYLWINVEIWILVLSVLFISLWYTILAIIDKRIKKMKNFCYTIEEIVIKEKRDE